MAHALCADCADGDGECDTLLSTTYTCAAFVPGGPYAGYCDFACGLCGDDSGAVNVNVGVRIVTLIYGNEITWNIDGGNDYGPYVNNADTTTEVPVAEGDHTLYYFDSYGDGWHGGYWELTDSSTGTHLAGGPTEGQVTGAGGEANFCIGSGCADFVPGEEVPVTVHIHTTSWANEIQWNIDSGQQFGVNPPFANNNDYLESMELPEGEHVIYYFDSYGDGWHGGFWEVLPGVVTQESMSGVQPVAGGPSIGQVSGAGGATAFVLSVSEDGVAIGAAGEEAAVEIHVHTLLWGNEITWNMDGGVEYGPYADYSTSAEPMMLNIGEHHINVMDSYGDGWHGGYWEVINGCGDSIAGGPDMGQVAGFGGVFPVHVTDMDAACPGGSSSSECMYENDGTCDEGVYCPQGTDLDDCSEGSSSPPPPAADIGDICCSDWCENYFQSGNSESWCCGTTQCPADQGWPENCGCGECNRMC